MASIQLSGKVAIVTGSSRGIGKATAIALARAGACVVVAARTEAALDDVPGTIGETVEAIRAIGGQAIAVRCDVAREEDVNNAVRRATEEFGGLDILVNNAAIRHNRPVTETPPEVWDRVMLANVKGPFLCCRAAIPELAKRGGGSILNISSPAAGNLHLVGIAKPGERPGSTGAIYGASKAALDRFTRGLAAEVANLNIAVNALKPAMPTYSEGLRAYFRNVDPAHWLSADRYATKAVLFLAAQDARGITGQLFEDQALCQEYGLE